MSLTVVDHPLVQHLLATLRDAATPPPRFRAVAKRLSVALVIEAVRDLRTTDTEVRTPLERTTGERLDSELCAVAILRAGLGMVDAVLVLFPRATVGFIGLERDDATLTPSIYYEKLPEVDGRQVVVLDPMLATGGTAVAACHRVAREGPAGMRFVCVVAAPEGVERMSREHPDVPVYAAALDRGLNDRGYILPGLGDFGDRLFGTPGGSGLPG